MVAKQRFLRSTQKLKSNGIYIFVVLFYQRVVTIFEDKSIEDEEYLKCHGRTCQLGKLVKSFCCLDELGPSSCRLTGQLILVILNQKRVFLLFS